MMTDDLNTLAWLIQTRMKDRGWSYRDVGKRGDLPHGTVAALARKTGHAEPPRPATVQALALGLDVPEDIVHACAGDSAGFEVELPPGYASVRAYVDLWFVADGMKRLKPEMREAFVTAALAICDTPTRRMTDP